MKDIQHGKLVFECDSCEQTIDTECDPDNWQGAMHVLKREGWHVCKIADEWLHGCPRHKP